MEENKVDETPILTSADAKRAMSRTYSYAQSDEHWTHTLRGTRVPRADRVPLAIMPDGAFS